jgi:hypothetical protein
MRKLMIFFTLVLVLGLAACDGGRRRGDCRG